MCRFICSFANHWNQKHESVDMFICKTGTYTTISSHLLYPHLHRLVLPISKLYLENVIFRHIRNWNGWNCSLIIWKLMANATADTPNHWHPNVAHVPCVLLFLVEFRSLSSNQLRFASKWKRYYGLSIVPVYRVKFSVFEPFPTNPFVIFAHLFCNLCWSLVMINLQLHYV